MKRVGKWLGVLMAFAALLLVSAACGSTEENSADVSSSAQNNSTQASEEGQKPGAESLSGEILLDGSSTVYPIMEGIAEEFTKQYPDVNVSVGVSGTGGGFERFTAGETDLSNASRPIKDEEASLAEENGIQFTELQLAYDGLSVVVNPENDWVDYLTLEELKKMWIDTGEAVTWADIREGWPEEEIEFFSPGTDSGTYDYWNEVVLEDEPMVRQATLSEDDNVLVQGVMGSPHSIAYFGYSYYYENQNNLKVVPIVNPDTGEPVEPNSATIESGEYSPLSRPLFTYVKHESLERPEVQEFVKFVLENAGTIAEQVGYVKLPDEHYTEQLDAINQLIGQ
jgi:phosphate transport system substrate-binding protein